MVVELREQAAPWVAVDGTGKEEGRNKAEQDEATHGSCHDFPQEGFFMVGYHRTWIRIPVFGTKSMMLQQHAFFRTSFVSRGNILRFIGHVVFSTKLY